MKLKKTYETECYISDGGYYVIRQDDDYAMPGMVLLSPSQMQNIINHMTETAIDPSWWDERDETNV